jgi:hypothetical protein
LKCCNQCLEKNKRLIGAFANDFNGKPSRFLTLKKGRYV